MQPARARSDDVDDYTARIGRRLQRLRHPIGIDSDRRRIAGNEKPRRHCTASASSAASLPSSSRPTMRPSSIADGATEQRPRQ